MRWRTATKACDELQMYEHPPTHPHINLNNTLSRTHRQEESCALEDSDQMKQDGGKVSKDQRDSFLGLRSSQRHQFKWARAKEVLSLLGLRSSQRHQFEWARAKEVLSLLGLRSSQRHQFEWARAKEVLSFLSLRSSQRHQFKWARAKEVLSFLSLRSSQRHQFEWARAKEVLSLCTDPLLKHLTVTQASAFLPSLFCRCIRVASTAFYCSNYGKSSSSQWL